MVELELELGFLKGLEGERERGGGEGSGRLGAWLRLRGGRGMF